MRAMTALMAGLAAMASLLLSGAAQATNYTFPGSMPAGCSGSGGSYSCGALSLGWNDTISIADPKPATITINGTLSTDTSTINSGGVASDLNLVVTGALTTGFQAVLNANVTAASVNASGGGTEVKFGGSLSATGGPINLLFRTTVAGSIQTSGAISLGQESVVSGSVTGTTGPVDVGYAAKVTGPITTSSGAISFEQSSVASGCVTSTGSAPITLKYQASVAGVCCGASCDNLCVTNNSTYAMPAACAPPVPALVLAKTASATDVAVGTSFSYTLTASNSGSAALNDVAVTDVIPTGLTHVASVATSGAVSVTGQTLTWTIPTLAADSSAQLTLVVLATQQGTFSNTVTAPGALPASAPDVKVGTPPNAYVHYRMDEVAGAWAGTLGEVKDSGSKELHGSRIPTGASGTNVVTPNPAIPSPPVLGSFCNAGKFDGSGAVKTPSNAYFSFTDTLSASVWIYPTAYPSSDLYSILSNDVNYEFHLNTGGRLYWWWQDSGGGAHSLTSSDLIPLNQWTHVAITMDATSANKRERIYINGQLRASGSWSGALRTNTCPFYIGGDISTDGHCTLVPGRNFHGMIDEAKIYNYELSADDVEADMTLGRQCTGVFDHIQIEHDGVASICAPETVTLKACVDAACSTLYTGDVTVGLSPAGWVGGDSFTFSGGVTSRELSHGAAGDVTLGTTGVSPVPAGATRCFKGATESCAMNFAASSCLFDAVEKNANPKTRLFTKLAGVPFNVDVLRLSSSGAINTSYKGTVAVDLVDGSSSACPTGSGLNTATNITYVAGNKGRKTVAFTYDKAARNVRVRAKVGSSLPACSTDSFTIRPQSFNSIASIANADSTGASATAMPATKAGSTFSLTAGTGVAGYDGNPKANPALIEWGSVSTGALDGSTPGSPVFSTAALAATGNGASGSFTYNEVGYFRFKANGVYDDTFTVDSGDKAGDDCVVDSFSNTLTGGKYGCGFGHASPSSYFGRFIPDHFDTAVTQGCVAGGFTYSGQPFPLTVTARNLAGGATANYAGDYAHQVTLAARNAGDTAGNPGPGVLASNVVLATGFAAGVASATPTYTFDDARTAPTDVRIRATEPEVSSLRAAPAVTVEGVAAVRSGRARLGSAYGSELLDLPVLFRTEFWNGTGWVLNAADSCTGNATVDAANAVSVTLAPSPADLPTCIRDAGNPGLSGANACVAVVPARQFHEGGGAAGFAGEFNLWLAAPGANSPGWTTVTAAVPAWLGVVQPTRATFGSYRTPLIYRREVYGF